MPTIGAFEGKDLASGDFQNVMFTGDGTAILGSRNLLPNPDLKDFGPRGEPEYYLLDAPDRPDGWEVYIRQLTRVDGQGNHIPLSETRLMKQTVSTLPMSRSQYTQSEPLQPGAPPPEPGREAKIAPPTDPPRVRAVQRTGGSEGFAAGTYWVGVAWILDGKPKTSMRITTSSPAKQVTVQQGQAIRVYMPEEAPEGVVGAAILLSKRNGSVDTMTIQDRIDLRRRYPESVVLRGPYHKGRTKITPSQGLARTPYESLPPPRVWFESANVDLDPMTTALSYRIVYTAGVTASQQIREVSVGRVESEIENRALCWRPPAGVLRDAVEWIPEFRGKDGRWYTLPARSPRQEARLFTNDTGKGERWTAKVNGKKITYTVGGWRNAEKERPRQNDRTREDNAHVPGPDALPTDPEPVGMVKLPPGRYAVRTAFAVDGPGNRDEISAPSPPTVVTLPPSAPGAQTTDYMIRVYRPGVQNVDNAEFTEKDPLGEIDLDWTDAQEPSVAIWTDNNTLYVNDTSGATTTADIRTSKLFPINPNRRYYVRHHYNITRANGGAMRSVIRFFDDADQFLGGRTVIREDTVGQGWAELQLGPRDSNAEATIPENATQARLVFQSIGGDGHGARNIRYEIKNIGFFTGGRHRKRLPIDFGLRNDRDEPDKRTDPDERPEHPYPNGAYCRVVRDPDDPPRIWQPTLLRKVSFDSGGVPSDVTLWQDGGVTYSVVPYAGITGDYGLLIQKNEGTSGGGAMIIANYSGRTSLARAAAWRIQEITGATSTDSVVLMRMSTSETVLAELRYEPYNRVLRLRAYNGNDAGGNRQYVTVDVARNVEVPFALAAELWARGAGTSNGIVELSASTRTRRFPRVVLRDLQWGGVSSISTIQSGIREVQSPIGFRLVHDDILDTADSIGDTDPLQTNYVEYYAPPGTPVSSEYFCRFERVPVRPRTNYTLSAYLGCQNVPERAEVWRTAFTDRAGRVIQLNEPLARIRGDTEWRRFSRQLRCDDDRAEYLVCVGNAVGEGLFRLGAAQLEEGSLSPWTNQNATSGYFTVGLDTYIPGGGWLTEGGLELRDRWIRMGAVTTHEHDANGNQVTSVSLQIRSANTKDDLSNATWYNSLSALLAAGGKKRYAEIKVNLSTSDPTKSPEVRGVYLHVLRALPVLLRPDGSEFYEGAILAPLPPIAPRPLMAVREYATGRIRPVSMQRGDAPLWLQGLTAQFYDAEAVEEFLELQEYEDGFVIEDPEREVRYRVLITGVYPEPGPEDAPYWFHFTAEDFEAQVVEAKEIR